MLARAAADADLFVHDGEPLDDANRTDRTLARTGRAFHVFRLAYAKVALPHRVAHVDVLADYAVEQANRSRRTHLCALLGASHEAIAVAKIHLRLPEAHQRRRCLEASPAAVRDAESAAHALEVELPAVNRAGRKDGHGARRHARRRDG